MSSINTPIEFKLRINQIQEDLANHKWIDTNLEGRTKDGKIVRFFKSLLRIFGHDSYRNIRINEVVQVYVQTFEVFKDALDNTDKEAALQVLKTLKKQVIKDHRHAEIFKNASQALKTNELPIISQTDESSTLPPLPQEISSRTESPDTSLQVDPPVKIEERPLSVELFSAPLSTKELALPRFEALKNQPKIDITAYEQLKTESKMKDSFNESYEETTRELTGFELTSYGMNLIKTDYESLVDELDNILKSAPQIIQSLNDYEANLLPVNPSVISVVPDQIPNPPPLPPSSNRPLPPPLPPAGKPVLGKSQATQNLENDEIESLLRDIHDVKDSDVLYQTNSANRSKIEQWRREMMETLFPGAEFTLSFDELIPYMEKTLAQYRGKVVEWESNSLDYRKKKESSRLNKSNDEGSSVERTTQEINYLTKAIQLLNSVQESAKNSVVTSRRKSDLERLTKNRNSILQNPHLTHSERDLQLQEVMQQIDGIASSLDRAKRERVNVAKTYKTFCDGIKILIPEIANRPFSTIPTTEEFQELKQLVENRMNGVKSGEIAASDVAVNPFLTGQTRMLESVKSFNSKTQLKKTASSTNKVENTTEAVIKVPNKRNKLNTLSNAVARQISELNKQWENSDIKYSSEPFEKAKSTFATLLKDDSDEDLYNLVSELYTCHQGLLELVIKLSRSTNIPKPDFTKMLESLEAKKQHLPANFRENNRIEIDSGVLKQYKQWMAEFIDEVTLSLKSKNLIAVIAKNMSAIDSRMESLPERFKNEQLVGFINDLKAAHEAYSQDSSSPIEKLDQLYASSDNFIMVLGFLNDELGSFSINSGWEGFKRLTTAGAAIRNRLTNPSEKNWLIGLLTKEFNHIKTQLPKNNVS
ncbi:MAG: hypothetical protein ACK5MA_02680 [Parachlamydiaceae bacterium]